MSTIIIGDFHIGARNNNAVILGCQERFFENLFFPFCVKNKVKSVIQLGDFLDSRTSLNFTALKFLNSILDEFEKNQIEVYSLLGNHDIYYKNSLMISGIRDLTLGRKYFHSIDKPKEIKIEQNKYLFIPWICSENQKECQEAIQNHSGDSILCGHLELDGFNLSENMVSKTTNSTIFKNDLEKFKKVYSGHYHLSSDQGNISYVGTPYELTWNDFGNRKRFFYVSEIDNNFQDVSILEHSIHHKFFFHENIEEINLSKLYGFAKVYVSKKLVNSVKYQQFISRLESDSNLKSISFIPIENEDLKNKEINFEIVANPIEIIHKHLESTEIDVSKENVLNHINRLYQKALLCSKE